MRQPCNAAIFLPQFRGSCWGRLGKEKGRSAASRFSPFSSPLLNFFLGRELERVRWEFLAVGFSLLVRRKRAPGIFPSLTIFSPSWLCPCGGCSMLVGKGGGLYLPFGCAWARGGEFWVLSCWVPIVLPLYARFWFWFLVVGSCWMMGGSCMLCGRWERHGFKLRRWRSSASKWVDCWERERALCVRRFEVHTLPFLFQFCLEMM